MLDMGFLPDIRRVLKHLPRKRQTLFFSATMPPPIVELAREMLQEPVHGQPRAQGGAGRRDHAGGLSGGAESEGAAARRAARSAATSRTCSSSRAPSTAPTGWPRRSMKKGVACERIHGNRCQAQRTRGARRLQEREVPRPRGDRHRRPRHRRRGALARRQLRRAERPGGLHPPRRPHGARGDDRRRLHVRVAGGGDATSRRSSARSASGFRASPFPDFDYAHGAARSASRCRSPSGSPQIRARKAEERLRAKAEGRAPGVARSRRVAARARGLRLPPGPRKGRPDPGTGRAHGHRTSHGQPAQPSAG